MSDCVFCMIINKEIPSTVIYEDDKIMAFHDVEPQAPAHCLIVTKKHIASLDEIASEDIELIGYLITKVKDIAAELGIENGYRLVNNCGEDAMQSVKHMHFHLLGKRKLTWPPG